MKPKEISRLMTEAIEHVEKEEMEQAREKFEKLREEASDDPQVLYNLGIFYSQVGEHPDASEMLTKAVELDPENLQNLTRLMLEDFHIGGGEIFQTDFMAFDPTYLTKAKDHCENALKLSPDDNEFKDWLDKIETAVMQNRMAFKYLEGDLEYCRKTVGRKKQLTNLDERVMGFLNLLDSGEYDLVPGRFEVVMKSDLPKDTGEGFLNSIRNYLLGK